MTKLLFVNYKDFHTKSAADAPDLEHIIEDLHINTHMCFGSIEDSDSSKNESLDEYKRRIIRYLHTNLEPLSSSPSAPRNVATNKRQRRGHHVCGIRCKSRTPSSSHKIERTRWEIFAFVTFNTERKKWNVDASCLVEFDEIFGSCEIHEVCVATPGFKLCQRLIENIRTNLVERQVRELRIYCENSNLAACACYARCMKGATVINTPSITAYSLLLHKK